MNKFITLIILLLINFGCKKTQTSIDVFNGYLKNVRELKSEGYTDSISGHTNAYFLELGEKPYDTIIHYVVPFDHNNRTISNSYFLKMNLSNCDTIYVKQYLNKNNCKIISKMEHSKYGYFFFIKNEKKEVFNCSIDCDGEYNFSIGHNDIMNNIENDYYGKTLLK